jgi:molybdenum-dependent DNA-binding transcriptional regulator ModE
MYELKIRTWLERDGRFIMSDGRAQLLKKIKDSGSLMPGACSTR